MRNSNQNIMAYLVLRWSTNELHLINRNVKQHQHFHVSHNILDQKNRSYPANISKDARWKLCVWSNSIMKPHTHTHIYIYITSVHMEHQCFNKMLVSKSIYNLLKFSPSVQGFTFPFSNNSSVVSCYSFYFPNFIK